MSRSTIESHKRAARQRTREHDELHRQRLRELEKFDAEFLAPWREEIEQVCAHVDPMPANIALPAEPMVVVPGFVYRLSLDAALEIEDALATEHPAAQRRAAVQILVTDAILRALGEVE